VANSRSERTSCVGRIGRDLPETAQLTPTFWEEDDLAGRDLSDELAVDERQFIG
jgi:hypothetical protein